MSQEEIAFMYKNQTQREKYNDVYRENEYKFDVPDLKITDGKDLTGKKILILGAGTARDVRYLLKGNDVSAVDFSKTSVDFLKELGIHAVEADLNEPLSYKDGEFDLIIAKDILEHLDNPAILAGEIFRMLSANGYAVINVPNHFFIPMRLRILLGHNMIWKTIDHDHTKDFKEWDYMHKIFFTWNGFREFLKLNKLKITKTFWDFGTLNHYSQPELVFEFIRNRKEKRSVLLSKILEGLWYFLNFVFPSKLRSYLVSLSPSLLCASFYVWVKHSK